jgi:hypothetical protein
MTSIFDGDRSWLQQDEDDISVLPEDIKGSQDFDRAGFSYDPLAKKRGPKL